MYKNVLNMISDKVIMYNFRVHVLTQCSAYVKYNANQIRRLRIFILLLNNTLYVLTFFIGNATKVN